MTTQIQLRFPAGHYHATPWSSHVNEGHIEWPPSPWRILRALIAVGYATLWPDGTEPTVARALVTRLAATTPRYRLPPVSTGHTRHYMPLGVFKDGREHTTLVFDAFLVPAGGRLDVEWPVALPAEESALLTTLVRNLSYLGRAESWVEGAVVEGALVEGNSAVAGSACWPCREGARPQGPGWEQIAVLAPISADAFGRWRESQLAAIEGDPQWQSAGKKLTPAQAKKHAAALDAVPVDLWDCLTRDIGRLQAEGWGQPPGSEHVLYWRSTRTMAVAAPRLVRQLRQQTATCVLLSVAYPSGNRSALPSTTRTLPQAELLHRAVISRLAGGKAATTGLELIGKDLRGEPLRGNQHAHSLPLDLDRDGHIDHILVWAPGGLSNEAVAALRATRETVTKGSDEPLRLAVAGVGEVGELSGMVSPWGAAIQTVTGRGKRWRTETPFVPPRFLKPRGANCLAGQVEAELRARGLPAPVTIRVWNRDEALASQFRHFVRERRGGQRPPPQPTWVGFDVEFAEEVEGPLCIGYASHFGLGRLGLVLEDECESYDARRDLAPAQVT